MYGHNLRPISLCTQYELTCKHQNSASCRTSKVRLETGNLNTYQLNSHVVCARGAYGNSRWKFARSARSYIGGAGATRYSNLTGAVSGRRNNPFGGGSGPRGTVSRMAGVRNESHQERTIFIIASHFFLLPRHSPCPLSHFFFFFFLHRNPRGATIRHA